MSIISTLAAQMIAFLILMWSSRTMASYSTDVVSVTDIETYLETGQTPAGSNSTFPTFLTSTIIIAANPSDSIFDTVEVTYFQQDMKYFYEQIFDSQSEYDLTVRSVDVLYQTLEQDGQTLDLETKVDVNFRPNPSDQTLTQEGFHNIVLNLVNKFESELVQFLKKKNSDMSGLQSIEARSIENDADAVKPIGLYILAGVGGLVVIAALAVCYILYKRQRSLIPKYVSGAQSNLSPFHDDIEFPSKDTVILDADDEDDNTFNSHRFSFRPGYKVPASPEPSVTIIPQSPRQDYFDGYDRSSLHLTLDTIPNSSSNEPYGTRVELWAPAGKLGVAIDVVEGRPIVWRIKPGSPLEGFLDKGDMIVAIDEIDTSRMSAADVTSLMVRRMRQRRKIAYIRPGS